MAVPIVFDTAIFGLGWSAAKECPSAINPKITYFFQYIGGGKPRLLSY
jgi:hypothetical protein